MKIAKTERILAIVLTLTMMMSLMLVFTVSGSAEASGSKYTLDVAELNPFAVGAKDNGDYEKAGTNDYFTVFYSEKTKVEVNEKSFTGGVSASQRIAWGAKSEIGDQILNAVKIKTQGSALVKLYWVGGDVNRNPAIFDASGKVVAQDTTVTEKNATYVTEFQIPSEGIYYIGNLGGSNYFYNIQVIDSNDGAAPAERADWASVSAPVVTSAVDNGLGNIVVSVDALVGHDGADELLVHMYSGDTLIATKGSVTEKSSHTLTFTPADSGNYAFKVELLRAGEDNKAGADASADFVYVLVAPYISSVTSLGGGSIEIKWSGVHEAESYKIYQDGAYVTTVDGSYRSHTVSGLTIGQEYSFAVSAVRGSEEIKSSAMSTVASAEAKQAWGFTVYGPSTNEDNNGYIGSVNDDGYVTVYSKGGKGKIVPASVDGIAFYYTAIPTEYNFTLRAKVTVDSWTFSNGQEGFGLIVTDRLGTNGDKSNVWNNQVLIGSTKFEYKYNPETEEVFDTTGVGTKYIMKLGIGTTAKTGVTYDRLNSEGDMSTEMINQYFRSRSYPLELSATRMSDANGLTYNVIGNYTGSLGSTLMDDRYVVTELDLEIQKNNSGYFVTYYDKDGNVVMQQKHFGADALNQLDEDFVYAGFFASRNARATFSDVQLTTILASEDAPAELPPTTYITPNITVASKTSTTSPDYTLIIDPNVDGFLNVTYEGVTLVDNVKLTAETRFKHSFKLSHYDENVLKITFDPDPNQVLPQFTELANTRKIVNTLEIDFNKGNYHKKAIYISPDAVVGNTVANGSKEYPYDIFTAIANAYPGQTLILMEGTYKIDSSLKIERGNDGTKDAMIRLIADPEATTRPVINFMGLGTGIVHGGNYWYFYGFDVTGTADGFKGFQVSGNYNVLDQINTYENGNTGIQLSRYASADLYEDWPAYNLVLNCTSYHNHDQGFEDADGFAAKLTIGPGNVFDGCVAYNNADDGWDLYAKVETGSIGAVTIRNCISYDNGFIPGYSDTGNGNGFKMGGESLSGKHVLENCIAFGNLAKGIDSNSCPDIIVKNCISFNNGGSNVALYTNNSSNTDFAANGVISFRTDKMNIAENLKPKGNQNPDKYYNDSTYYWDASSGSCKNVLGDEITADMFVSLVFNGFTRNADGSINLGGFLEIKDNVPANVSECKLGGSASAVITLEEDLEHKFSPAWYKLDDSAHWHECECGDKSHIEYHTFIWIIDKAQVGNQNGSKHQECTTCGYKKATITIYPPTTPVEPEVNPDTTPDVQPGFFEIIWQAIINFFKTIFPFLFNE